jgi:hypothetical protein
MFSLRKHLGGYKAPRYLLRERRESYGLSHDTWTRGRHELEDAGLLAVNRSRREVSTPTTGYAIATGRT